MASVLCSVVGAVLGAVLGEAGFNTIICGATTGAWIPCSDNLMTAPAKAVSDVVATGSSNVSLRRIVVIDESVWYWCGASEKLRSKRTSGCVRGGT